MGVEVVIFVIDFYEPLKKRSAALGNRWWNRAPCIGRRCFPLLCMRSGITSQISGALGHGRLWQSQPNQCYSYESNEGIAVRLKARGANRKHSLSNCQEEVMNLQCTRPCRHTSGSSGRILCCFTKCSYLSMQTFSDGLFGVSLSRAQYPESWSNPPVQTLLWSYFPENI